MVLVLRFYAASVFVVNLFWLWVWRILLLFSVVVLWFWCGVCDFGDLAGEVPWVGLV